MAPMYEDWTGIESFIPAVHIDFTLMVNGKLRSFGWSFLVEKATIEEQEEHWYREWYVLRWAEWWETIFMILNALGYAFPSGSSDNPWGYNNIDEWVTKVMLSDYIEQT